MTTQQQAYIEGFVKRASEYGFNEIEAINILKKANFMDSAADIYNKGIDYVKNAPGQLINNVKDKIQSAGYNSAMDALTEGANIPHHIADYGMKNIGSMDFEQGLRDLFTNKYNADVFAKDHPLLNQASNFLKSNNINPLAAGAAVGGAGLLGGGYLLGKQLNKKKDEPTINYIEE